LLNISEIIIHPEGKLVGQTVQRAEEDLDFTIVFHQRGKTRDMHPAAQMQLDAGDKLVVVATLEQLNQLEQHNCPPKGDRPRRK
jgi:Trk K+ transport system NAD-binding subunit